MKNALLIVAVLLSQITAAASTDKALDWQKHDAQTFAKAAEQERLILLDLVAVWCHWCHVMEGTTYQDAAVIAQIEANYIPVQADHDARPDLAERYRDYGWPATIILTPDGQELVKRAGYISPEQMTKLLARTAAAKRPKQQDAKAARVAPSATLSAAVEQELQRRHLASYDHQQGGLALMQKFLDADSVEYDLKLAADGDAAAAQRARQSLDGAAKLIDPAFGGAYQYSVHGDWNNPHYEKIAITQAVFLRIFSLAYQQLNDPKYLRVAEQVADYIVEFWQSPEGGFYNSQDADLQQGHKAHAYFALTREQRLAQGLPKIDKNRYASSNGMLIEGLLALYQANGQQRHLQAAIKAFNWVMRQRRLANGGFRHGQQDTRSAYLADSLYMAQAMLRLHQITGKRTWLRQADLLATHMQKNFYMPGNGLLSAADNGTPVKPVPQIDQNIHAARFLGKLSRLQKRSAPHPLMTQVMRYLVHMPVATSRLSDPGILLAAAEFRLLQGSQIAAIENNNARGFNTMEGQHVYF